MRIPILNVYYLLCYAWGHLEESDVVDVQDIEEFSELQDLFGKVLAEGTFRLVRRGIDRDYREVHREIPGLRGKMDVGTTVKRALRARSRTACTYEELSHNVLHNRLVKSSLAALLPVAKMDSGVRQDVRLAYQKLEGIDLIRVTRQQFRRVQLDRNMQMYRFLLSVCELVHESVLIDQRSGDARFHDFREEDTTMWRLFEDFVAEFYNREFGSECVRKQIKIEWFEARAAVADHLDRIPEMRPDVVLDLGDRRIILDTKYYGDAFGGRFGSRKLHSGNLYQLLAYLRNRQATQPDGPRHEGILLYPTVDETVNVDVELEGFRIQARSVNLGRHWRDVRAEMLAVVA